MDADGSEEEDEDDQLMKLAVFNIVGPPSEALPGTSNGEGDVPGTLYNSKESNAILTNPLSVASIHSAFRKRAGTTWLHFANSIFSCGTHRSSMLARRLRFSMQRRYSWARTRVSSNAATKFVRHCSQISPAQAAVR